MKRNLQKANEILESISKQNKNITPITPKDYDLFNEFFAKEPHTYGNSWSYIIQGMYGLGENNLGYKYYDGENLSAISIHPKIEKPEQLAMYFVRPMGKGIMKIIAELGKNYKQEFDLQIYAKKLFKNQYDEIMALGFKDIKENPWHSLAIAEDDTYPEIMYDPKSILDDIEKAPRKVNIKKNYNRIQNLLDTLNIRISSDNFEKNAWMITKKFFQEEERKKNKYNFSDEYDYYNLIFNTDHDKTIEKKIVFIDGEALGYYFLEKQNTDISCAYALITLHNKHKYLADLIYFHIFSKNKNSNYLNFGGSEDIGLQTFKTKFSPFTTQQLFWATLI